VKEAIRQRALELGFEACRFTSAAPPDSAEHFNRWLQSHWHGEMGYLQRNAHKRIDPSQVRWRGPNDCLRWPQVIIGQLWAAKARKAHYPASSLDMPALGIITTSWANAFGTSLLS
jgi:hypothetical protein